MARAKQFDVTPDPILCVLAKVLDATREKRKLSDRDRYKDALTPGEHRFTGTLDYDILFNVGADSETDRYYGTPLDTILLLAFHFSGALREHFTRAAMICRELRLAELEGTENEDGTVTPRPYQDVSYTFPRVEENQRGFKVVNEKVTIPAAQVAVEADRIAGKLTGLDEEATKREQQKRDMIQQQIAACLGKLKVRRKYEGPVNIEDVSLEVHKQLVVVAHKVA